MLHSSTVLRMVMSRVKITLRALLSIVVLRFAFGQETNTDSAGLS